MINKKIFIMAIAFIFLIIIGIFIYVLLNKNPLKNYKTSSVIENNVLSEKSDNLEKEIKNDIDEKIKEEEMKKVTISLNENFLKEESINKEKQVNIELFDYVLETNVPYEKNLDKFDIVSNISKKDGNRIKTIKDNTRFILFVCTPYVQFSNDEFKNNYNGKDIFYTDEVVNLEFAYGKEYLQKIYIGNKEENICYLIAVHYVEKEFSIKQILDLFNFN